MLIHPVTKKVVSVPKQLPDHVRAQFREIHSVNHHQGKMFSLETRAHFKGDQK